MKTASTSQPEVLVVLLADIKVDRQLDNRPCGDWAPSSDVMRGLCVNCDHRYYCTYPKPPGGVWSCDEYV